MREGIRGLSPGCVRWRWRNSPMGCFPFLWLGSIVPERLAAASIPCLPLSFPFLTVRLGSNEQRHPFEPLHVCGRDVPGASVVPLPLFVERVDLHPPPGIRHGGAPARSRGKGKDRPGAESVTQEAFNSPLFMTFRSEPPLLWLSSTN